MSKSRYSGKAPPPSYDDTSELPYSGWLPFLAGASVGIGLRLIFSGHPGGTYATMMGSFIFLTPIVVGMVTVYVAEKQHRRSWSYYVWAPAFAAFLLVVGTMAILIEGLICAVLIVPLFMVLGAIGGLVMGLICRYVNRPRTVLYSFAVLPVLLAPLEAELTLPNRVSDVERSVVVAAPPAVVWREIWNARDIQPQEVDQAWMYRIGVPLPRSGITQMAAYGPVRRITMGKGIHFDQVVTQWHPERDVHWTYRFADDSFPPAALDDHVRIGGHYFDLLTTSYTLAPEGEGTRLTIHIGYRVSTRFNWYSGTIAELLIGNFEDVILDFYRKRSETQAGGTGGLAAPSS